MQANTGHFEFQLKQLSAKGATLVTDVYSPLECGGTISAWRRIPNGVFCSSPKLTHSMSLSTINSWKFLCSVRNSKESKMSKQTESKSN